MCLATPKREKDWGAATMPARPCELGQTASDALRWQQPARDNFAGDGPRSGLPSGVTVNKTAYHGYQMYGDGGPGGHAAKGTGL